MPDHTLEYSLQTADVAVCVKDIDKRVLSQSADCRAICGEQLGKVCEVGCMELHARDNTQQWKDWGSRVYRNIFLNGTFFDITLLCSSCNIITFLQPLEVKYDMALDYYREKGLTKREMEVVSLTIKGISNAQICTSLSISKATLRTHLNTIYRKSRHL